MHARVLSLILTLFVSSFLIPVSAQIFQPEGLNIPGEWNGWTNPPAAGAFLSSSQAGGLVNLITTGERRWTTTFQSDYTGSRQFLFTSGPSGNPYNNKWGGVTTTLNTIQNYFYQSGTNNSVNVTNGKYYTINWDDNGYVNTNAIVMETSNAPVTISSDSQNPVSSAVYNYNSVIVTANLSASLSPEEKVYLRYSTDNWVNITNVLMTVSGSTAQAVIPPFATGTNVSYSIVTTTRTFANNEGNYNADLSTIRRNENNRSYTVLAPIGGCVAVGNPSDWGINQWNVYVYNASSANAWVNNYVGYYSMPDLSFNTDLNQTNSNFYSWDKNGSPANAPGYQGCTAGNDNHSFRMKRQGFPCGAYQISVTDIDDLGELYVNGTLVWKNHVCCGLSSAVWGGYLDANSTVEFKVLELSGGSVCGLTFASLPEPTAVITPTNPTEINCNGVITLSNVSGGACHLVSAPFNGVIPSGSSFYGSGQIPSGDPNYCMLTPNNGSQLGTWAYTPTYRPTAFSVRYRQYMGQGSEADGMSFNYGNFNPAVGGGESGFGKLVIAFKTYGADVVQLLYDGVLIASYSPSFGLSNEAWTPTQIDISADGKVTLIFNGTTVFNQVQLPAGYATADKSNWIYAFSGRTGAATDLHAIDDLTIYSRDNLEFFVSGVTSSWTTSKTINAPAGTYTVQARNVCGTGCTYTLGSVTINDPSSPSLTVTSTNGTGQSYNDGVADCGMSSSTFGWLTDGSYSVTVNGCTNANYTVTEEFVVNGTVQNTETWNLSGTATWTPNRFWSVGVTTVNVTVTDSEGNAFTTTYTVTITDNEPLSIVAPADITACSGTTVDLGSATVGGCWTNVSNDAPANLPLGNTTITWTITGASGNTATDTQVVTIIETVTPSVTISASPDLQVCPAPSPGGNDENQIFFTASTTNCGDNPTFQWYVNGDNWWYNSPNVSGNVFIGGEQIYVTVIPTNDCQTSNLVTSNILVPVAMNAQSYYVDYDGDGYGNSFNSQMACSPQPGLTTVGGDCDDYNANAYPGATEICGNGADDDCQNGDIQCTGCTNSTACNYSASATIDDGSCVYPQTYYYDGDGDGYGINELPALANSTYFVQSIPYTTFPYSTTECVPDNSQYDWANLPIGFSFPFYNQTYNSFNVTDKGYVSFGSWLPWWQSSGSPSPVPSGTEDLIAFGWSDWGGAGCNARVQYYSNPAKAVVYHSAYYHLSNYSGGSAGAQDNFMALYPNGVIEMYVNNSYQTPNYIPNNNPAQSPASQRYVMGVQGGDGSAGTGISPYNYAVGHNISQQAWRLYMPVVSACSQPSGYVLNNTDCDDSNASVNAGGTEICGNGIDDDCIGGDLACNVPGCTDNTACNYNSAATNDDGSCSYGSSFYADTDNDGYGAGTATQACTQPTGFVTNNTDCNDSNSVVYPGATETCNTVDDDCDGTTDEGVQTTFYADVDVDGFGGTSTTAACTAPTGYVGTSTDCDDSDNAVYPGATETCNSIDDDCDGTTDEGVQTTFYADVDGDGFGGTSTTQACTAPTGYVSDNTDCNDSNSTVYPGATETCNTVDDDCDGTTDEGVQSTFYADADGDGFGGTSTTQACTAPTGYVSDNTDCNDSNSAVYPGATETCNNIDDDCDGSTDEGVQSTFYADVDGDGFGGTSTTQACTAPTGYVGTSTDCNDSNSAVYPGATETCNSIDDDCDGTTDEGVQSTFYADADGDGYGELATSTDACTAPTGYVSNSTDCDDSDNAVYPGATEICNDIDDDCDGTANDGLPTTTYYLDGDGDGFGTTTSADFCEDPGVGYATNNTDCNDTNAQINPTATELCNGVDDNCNNQTDEGLPFTDYYVDSDGDGFGAGTAASFCANPGASYATTNTDCNNGDANIYPGATEICNGVDDDCDGSTDEGVLNTYYADADGDGYGNSGNTQTACSQPIGYVTVGGDCFDGSAAINPGATEICNNIDDNCDGTIDNAFVNYYADSDGDGFGGGNAVSIQSCTTPAGYTTSATDCNNGNANVYPGAIEICNGIDDDCDSNIDEGVLMTYYLDSDGDGFGGTTSTTGCSAPNGYVSSSTDCNDTNSAVNPGATEVCNSIDDDCDGTTDEGCPSTTPGEEPSNAVSAPSSYYSYCSNFYGTLAGALPSTYAQSTCVTGEDKWYTFTALSSGVTIFIGSYFNDILIELQDVNGNLIETENAVNGIGTEVMNYVGLTAGQVYRVGVRNYNSNLAAGNQFSGCIRHLKRGGCDSGTVGGGNWPSQISMCSVFKATYAGSGVQYRYTWTGLTGGATGNVYTRTQSSDYLSLTNVTPTLQSGCQYSVLVTNLYTIANGAGVNEVLEVPALAPCTITILADATVQLRSTDQCSNGPRFRSSVVASLPWVCGVNNWRWRFTEVNPSTYQVIGLPIEINRGAASNYLNLGTVAALQYGKTYAVQTAPVFTYTGSNYQWGPVQYLCIIGQSGMILNNDSNNQAEDNRSDFGIAQDFDMALYPNPTNGDELNITLSGVSGDDQALVRIMNTFGQIVYEGKWNSEGVIQKQINVSRWSNGMYLFEVRSGEQTLTKRFMISQ